MVHLDNVKVFSAEELLSAEQKIDLEAQAEIIRADFDAIQPLFASLIQFDRQLPAPQKSGDPDLRLSAQYFSIIALKLSEVSISNPVRTRLKSEIHDLQFLRIEFIGPVADDQRWIILN